MGLYTKEPRGEVKEEDARGYKESSGIYKLYAIVNSCWYGTGCRRFEPCFLCSDFL